MSSFTDNKYQTFRIKDIRNPIFFLPIINIFADTIIYLFESSGIIRGVFNFLVILSFMSKSRIVKHPIILLILFFSTYLFILSLLSSQPWVSISSGHLKWFETFFMFIFGYYYIRNKNDLILFIHSLFICAAIIVLNLSFAQIFKIGVSAYVEDSFYLGYAGVGITNSLSLILIISPLYFYLSFKKSTIKTILVILLLFISFLFVLLALKRAAILGLGLGIILYIYFYPKKAQIFKYAFFVILIFALSYNYFSDTLIQRFEARTTERNDIVNEKRYHEFFYVLEEIEENSIMQGLFGTELFNSGQFFGPKYFGKERLIHGDISTFLYGSGIIGLAMYLSIYLMIGLKLFKAKQNSNSNIYMNVIFTSAISIVLSSFLISVTGSGTIGERSITYLFLGGAIYMLTYYTKIQMDNNLAV